MDTAGAQGLPPPVDVPAEPEAVDVHGAVLLALRSPGLRDQRVTRCGHDLLQGARRAEVRQVAAHQASRAVRKPAKIWRRIGWSQLRNVVRQATGSVAQQPPRRTL